MSLTRVNSPGQIQNPHKIHYLTRLCVHSCRPTVADVVRFTDGSFMRINSTALSLYYKDELDYCEYQAIDRPVPPADGGGFNDGGPSPDNRFVYRRAVQFRADVDLSRVGAEFVRVACYGRRYGALLYTNFHAVVLLKHDVERRCRRDMRQFVADKRPTDVSCRQPMFSFTPRHRHRPTVHLMYISP